MKKRMRVVKCRKGLGLLNGEKDVDWRMAKRVRIKIKGMRPSIEGDSNHGMVKTIAAHQMARECGLPNSEEGADG